MTKPAPEELEKRKHVRFNVSSLNDLKFSFDSKKTQALLITLGGGGCGFSDKVACCQEANLPKRINCKFQLDGVLKEPIEVQGNIVFVREIDSGDSKLYLHGVEFIPSH